MNGNVRYVITGQVTTQTGLHVGSGWGNPRTDATVVKDLNDRPFIPGSSLKGALRSAVEQLVGPIPGLRSCQLSDASGERCISTSQEWQQAYDRQRETASETELLEYLAEDNKVCNTCQLFGSTAVASKLMVSDLPLLTAAGETEVRHGVGIDRDTETAREGVKFDFETVPSQQSFALEMIVDNPTETDLGLLAAGLHEMELGMIPLGGNSSRGVGRCQLEINRIVRVDLGSRAGLRTYLLDSEPRGPDQPRRIAGDALPVSEFIRDSIRNLLNDESAEG